MTLPPIRRLALLSAHTSPLDQPGRGDAGGMNVYVHQLAKKMAERSIDVSVFTRATSSQQAEVVATDNGYQVHHVAAGPFETLTKEQLPAQMCAFVRDVLRTDISNPFDVVHSHYWISGEIGTVVKERWQTPLVHSMHTMAKVKNAYRAAGERAEPEGRIRGEEDVVNMADRLIANSHQEVEDFDEFYGADRKKISVVHPGVDLDTFRPGDQSQVRKELGLPLDSCVVMFAGRIQPLKAPDVLVKAISLMKQTCRSYTDGLVVVIAGGISGPNTRYLTQLEQLAAGLGSTVRFVSPLKQPELAKWFVAADVVCMPSYNESFGLVALEAQACGTPVIASRVGGLTTAINDGVTGILIDGHEPADFARALDQILRDQELQKAMGEKARAHALSFDWSATVDGTLEAYDRARFERL